MTEARQHADVELYDAVEDLLAALTYDDSGLHGRGGNGGLISRETIAKSDRLRLLLYARRNPAPARTGR